MKLNTFQSNWQQPEKTSAIWKLLLLFVIGIVALLLFIKLMPYSVWVIAL